MLAARTPLSKSNSPSHTSPGSKVEPKDTSVIVRDEAGEPRVGFSSAVPAEVATGHGDEGAVPSWQSSNYGQKTATDAFAFVRQGTDAWFVTAVGLGDRALEPTITATAATGGMDARLCVGGAGYDLGWRNLASGASGGEAMTTAAVTCGGGTAP